MRRGEESHKWAQRDLDEDEESEAVELWRKVFGKEWFPLNSDPEVAEGLRAAALAILASLGLWHISQGFEHLLVEYGAPYRLAASDSRVGPGLWLVTAGPAAAALLSLAYLARDLIRWLIRARQAQRGTHLHPINALLIYTNLH
jgi:hypothetical protein